MQDHAFQQPAAPNDPDEVILQLDEVQLLIALEQLRMTGNLSRLRSAVAGLKEQLCDVESELLSNGDAERCVMVPAGYLLGQLDQIAASLTIERARYYIERLIKSFTEVRTGSINNLNLNRWKEYDDIITDSLWVIERRERVGAHSASYWGNFIPQIPNQMMRRYTKQGEWVLDIFAGSGTTLIEGRRLGRHTLGIELQADVAKQACHLIDSEPNPYGVISEMITGDSAVLDLAPLLQCYGQRSAQLIILHPPYHDIIKFSDDPRDLSNAPSVEHFLELIGTVIDNATPVLDTGRYLVVVIGDKYAKGEWIPLGFLTMNEVLKRNFSLKSIIVKNFEETTGKRSQKELWRYRALAGGFFIFKHEYIFVFKKQRGAVRKV